jgi:hypothetical protein
MHRSAPSGSFSSSFFFVSPATVLGCLHRLASPGRGGVLARGRGAAPGPSRGAGGRRRAGGGGARAGRLPQPPAGRAAGQAGGWLAGWTGEARGCSGKQGRTAPLQRALCKACHMLSFLLVSSGWAQAPLTPHAPAPLSVPRCWQRGAWSSWARCLASARGWAAAAAAGTPQRAARSTWPWTARPWRTWRCVCVCVCVWWGGGAAVYVCLPLLSQRRVACVLREQRC